MASLENSLKAYHGKRVLITGHTGFKGSWLAYWLHTLGAKVYGFALEPEASSHFTELKLDKIVSHRVGDLRNNATMMECFHDAKPEIVFHLAAQPLVRVSYESPLDTFSSNAFGSASLLEAVRRYGSVRALVYVTSDKCYKNREWIWGYKETDQLGGYDPYSASKAIAEVIFQSYLDSFFTRNPNIGAASARAGNVIGGGDWSRDRIVPDCIRALKSDQAILIRRPQSTRPWQHVLESLGGYLMLGSRLLDDPKKYSGAWNFGPDIYDVRTTLDLAKLIVEKWGSGDIQVGPDSSSLHEAHLLALSCEKAKQLLGWAPRWHFEQAVTATVDWYKHVTSGGDARKVVERQIGEFTASRSMPT